MLLTPKNLELLACPICKVSVVLLTDTSALECPQCNRLYPIKDNIPQMMVEESFVKNK